MRANAWFNELKAEVVRLATTVFWQSADGVRSWYIQDDTINGRVEEHTAGANWKEVHYNGLRSELHNQDTAVWYENNQTTELVRMDKTPGGDVSVFSDLVVQPDGTASTLRVGESSLGTDRVALQFTAPVWHVELNGIRTGYHDPNNTLEYMSDGSTEIGRWARADGYLQIARVRSSAFNFYSNWQDFGGSWAGARWYESPDGTIHLEGLIRRINSVSPTTDPIILLPAGQRPPASRMFNCMTSTGAVARVDVGSNGQVIMVSGPAIPINGWITVSPISFRKA